MPGRGFMKSVLMWIFSGMEVSDTPPKREAMFFSECSTNRQKLPEAARHNALRKLTGCGTLGTTQCRRVSAPLKAGRSTSFGRDICPRIVPV